MIVETAIVCATVVFLASLGVAEMMDRRHVRPLEAERRLLEEHLKTSLTSSYHDKERHQVRERLREISEKLELPPK